MPVASTGHLIAMKLLARDDRRRPADYDDLRSLAEVATRRRLDLGTGRGGAHRGTRLRPRPRPLRGARRSSERAGRPGDLSRGGRHRPGGGGVDPARCRVSQTAARRRRAIDGTGIRRGGGGVVARPGGGGGRAGGGRRRRIAGRQRGHRRPQPGLPHRQPVLPSCGGRRRRRIRRGDGAPRRHAGGGRRRHRHRRRGLAHGPALGGLHRLRRRPPQPPLRAVGRRGRDACEVPAAPSPCGGSWSATRPGRSPPSAYPRSAPIDVDTAADYEALLRRGASRD